MPRERQRTRPLARAAYHFLAICRDDFQRAMLMLQMISPANARKLSGAPAMAPPVISYCFSATADIFCFLLAFCHGRRHMPLFFLQACSASFSSRAELSLISPSISRGPPLGRREHGCRLSQAVITSFETISIFIPRVAANFWKSRIRFSRRNMRDIMGVRFAATSRRRGVAAMLRDFEAAALQAEEGKEARARCW